MTSRNFLMILALLFLDLGINNRSLRAETAPNYSLPTDRPIVIELFTSQSCASCPPADKIFAQLANHENVIALGCHVSYWDKLVWKDTLSHDFCDVRQHGYASMTSARRIYTPQMIVNGGTAFIGSRFDEINKALNIAKKQNIEVIEIIPSENNSIQIVLPNLPKDPSGDYRLWLYGYKKQVTEKIGNGENSGLEMNYANAAVTYTNLGAWSGGAQTKVAPLISLEENDGLIILAQAEGYGRITAAGKLDFDKIKADLNKK